MKLQLSFCNFCIVHVLFNCIIDREIQILNRFYLSLIILFINKKIKQFVHFKLQLKRE
jgi:hypothetical protein